MTYSTLGLKLMNQLDELDDEDGDKYFDPENWKPLECLPDKDEWSGIAFGNGKFVAVAHNSQYIAYSEDAENWTRVRLESVIPAYDIEFGNGRFIIVNGESTFLTISEDGVNWRNIPITAYGGSSSTGDYRRIRFLNGYFWILKYGGEYAGYSSNGDGWTYVPLKVKAKWIDIAYGQITTGEEIYVAIAEEGNQASYSLDAVFWTPIQISYTDHHLTTIVFDPTTKEFMAFGKDAVLESQSYINVFNGPWCEVSFDMTSDNSTQPTYNVIRQVYGCEVKGKAITIGTICLVPETYSTSGEANIGLIYGLNSYKLRRPLQTEPNLLR